MSPADATPVEPPAPTTATRDLARTLIDARLTIATAESLTGGALSAELVRIPGISAAFLGGIVAYGNAAKHRLLFVSQSLLEDRGAVDAGVALAMARGARRQLGGDDMPADIGVSTTGVAGPSPEDGFDPGTVYLGLSTLWGDKTVRLDFSRLVRPGDPGGSRQRIREATVEAAIFNVSEFLADQ